MPAHFFEPQRHPLEETQIGHAAQMLHEIEAHAAHAAVMEVVKVLLGDAFLDDGNAPIAATRRGDGVEHGAVVAAMAARLHDDRPLDAEEAMERYEAFLRRIGWCVASARAVREFRRRPEHVAVGIARLWRRHEARFLWVGIGTGAARGGKGRHLNPPDTYDSARPRLRAVPRARASGRPAWAIR